MQQPKYPDYTCVPIYLSLSFSYKSFLLQPASQTYVQKFVMKHILKKGNTKLLFKLCRLQQTHLPVIHPSVIWKEH